jgi:hypothetical protein
MERASKRAHSSQFDLAWEFVDLVVTLMLGLAAAYAIATGKATEATAAALLAAFRSLRLPVAGGCNRSQGSQEELESLPWSCPGLPVCRRFL